MMGQDVPSRGVEAKEQHRVPWPEMVTLYDTENNTCNQDYVELRISTTRNVVVVYYRTLIYN